MPVEKITKTVWHCTCEFPDCVGIDPKTGLARPWDSKNEKIPDRCSWCKRRLWHDRGDRHNLRLNDPEFKWVRTRQRKCATCGSTGFEIDTAGKKVCTGCGKQEGESREQGTENKAQRTEKRARARPTIDLPKPKKVRNPE